MSTTKVAISLVTWNAVKYLPWCLDSVLNQTFKDYEILIIDNASTDGTVDFIRQNYPNLKVVVNKNNLGFSQAHNQAIHWTESQYVLCLNQDVILEPDFLQQAIDFLDHNSKIGSLTGKLLTWNFDESSILPKITKSGKLDSAGLVIHKNHQIVDIGQGRRDGEQFKTGQEIFGVSGAAPIYRRQALNDVKYKNEYFDENFFMYKEDVDLAYRLRWYGWSAAYWPAVVAYHQRGAQGKENFKSTHQHRSVKSDFVNYHSYKNHWYVLIKNETLNNIFVHLPHIFWYEFKKFIYLILFEKQTLKSFKEIKKYWRLMLNKRHYILKNKKVESKEIRQWYV
ncbi:MAG: glycosyltransferase family 2 protein [Patescibacteria group bacterium]|nr:glycosyltransferase family 2 protein [Patescibacteria group bacterium]